VALIPRDSLESISCSIKSNKREEGKRGTKGQREKEVHKEILKRLLPKSYNF
jgi:hypothetical protein